MSVFLRGNVYWYKFMIAGRLIRESADTTRKTVAIEAERNRRLEIEKTLAGIPTEKRETRIKTVRDKATEYTKHYSTTKRPKSVEFSRSRLVHVRRIVGKKMLGDLSEDIIRAYMQQRIREGVSGRTVNMELGELSRVIGKKWSLLWPNVKKLEERKDVGRALTTEEESRLLAGARESRSAMMPVFLHIGLLTAMRSGEITGLAWSQIDLDRHVITVGRAKTSSGTGRQIPINDELLDVIREYQNWYIERFDEIRPEWYVFPFGKPTPQDPSRPTTTIKTAWNTLRSATGVSCRLHDLRHTALTKMAEAGTQEHTMLAIAGHMSRAMLERYSHIRMAAKREAMQSIRTAKDAPQKDGVGTKLGTISDSGRLRRIK